MGYKDSPGKKRKSSGTSGKAALGRDADIGGTQETDFRNRGQIPDPIFTRASSPVQKDGKRWYNDPTDELANKKKQYIEIYHIPSGQNVFFKLFLTEFRDVFTAEYNQQTAFGRMDPIATYKRTGRVINLGWEVPSVGINDAKENLAKANRLIQMLYPVYETSPNNGSSVNLKSGPIFKIKMGNLIMRPGQGEVHGPAKEIGLTGIIDGFTYAPSLESGIFDPASKLDLPPGAETNDPLHGSWSDKAGQVWDRTKKASSTLFSKETWQNAGWDGKPLKPKSGTAEFDGQLYPQVIKAQIRFIVLHDTPLGFEEVAASSANSSLSKWKETELRQAQEGYNNRFPYGGNNEVIDERQGTRSDPANRPRNDLAVSLDTNSALLKRRLSIKTKDLLNS